MLFRSTCESLYVFRTKASDTSEVKVAVTRFTLSDPEKNAEMLRYIYSSILLDLVPDYLNSCFIKTCFQDSKMAKKPLCSGLSDCSNQDFSQALAFIPNRAWTASAAAGFLKTGQYPDFFRAPPKEMMFPDSRKQL